MTEVYLEQIRLSDAHAIAKWKSDKKLSDLILSDASNLTIYEAEGWIKKNSNDKNQSLFGIYIEEEKSKIKIVGITRLMFIDYESKVAELGIYIGKEDKRGEGIGSKALAKTLEHAFNELSLNKVFLRVREDNVAAIKLYTKYNFIIEGKLNEHYISNNNFINNNLLIMAKFKNK